MTHTAKVEIAETARKEITARINHADAINQQLKNNYISYSEETIWGKIAAFFLGLLIVSMIIFSPMMVFSLLKSFNHYNDQEISTVAIIALYTLAAYLALNFSKIMIHLNRIAKIDGHLNGINAIKQKLETYLNSVDKNIADIEKEIAAQNIIISYTVNVDEKIGHYQKIAAVYSNPNYNILNGFIKVAYWISSILLSLAFVSISATKFTDNFCDWLDIENHGIIIFIYASLALAFFIALHVIFSRNEYKFGGATYIFSLFSGPTAMMIMYGGIIIVAIAICVLIIVLVGKVLWGLISE